MTKSKSEEGIAGRHGYEEVELKKSPRLRRRYHDYEEIQPVLNYMDISKLDFSKKSGVRSKTDSLVKVEMDWKHKVHV